MPERTTLELRFAEPAAAACDVALASVHDDGAGIFRAYHGGAAYEVYSNLPEPCLCTGRGLLEDVEDVVTFSFTRAAALSRLPAGPVAYEWIGEDLGNVTVAGRDVALARAGVGVLLCRYQAAFDRWQLPADHWLYEHIHVVALCADVVATLGISPEQDALDEAVGIEDAAPTVAAAEDPQVWGGGQGDTLQFANAVLDPDETGEEVPVTVTVRDYCTKAAVAGATVSSSVGSGVTGPDGTVTLGRARQGQRVSLGVQSAGHEPVNTDILHNEWVQA